jgi:hypothetical protein
MKPAPRREGTLHIVWTNRAEDAQPKYTVVFADYSSSQGAMKVKEVSGEQALTNYLERINVHASEAHSALRDLKTQGNAAIFHTVLSDEQLASLGLK